MFILFVYYIFYGLAFIDGELGLGWMTMMTYCFFVNKYERDQIHLYDIPFN